MRHELGFFKGPLFVLFGFFSRRNRPISYCSGNEISILGLLISIYFAWTSRWCSRTHSSSVNGLDCFENLKEFNYLRRKVFQKS